MRTLGFLLIVILFVISVWFATNDESPAEPPTPAVHVVDPRGDVQWSPPTSSLPTTTTTPRARTAPSERCGGDLPPCSVMMVESGGNIRAYNPTGCVERDATGRVIARGCTGKWQCSHSTCKGTGTEAEQDDEARELWDDGRGCAHWSACGRAA